MKNSKKKFLRLFKLSWPILTIFILTLVFFWKYFVFHQIPIPGDFVIGTYYPWLDYKWGYEVGVPVKNPITTDVVSFTYPMRILAVNLIKSGQVPLWNQFILTGIPLMANFQSAPFTITNIFYLFFDNLDGWAFQVIFQHFFAAFFMYLLLRYWKINKISAIFGSMVFAFSGFNLIWSQWNAHTLSAAFIPLLFLITDITLKTNSAVRFLIPIIVFLQILSGYPQILIYTAIIIFVLWIYNFHPKKTYFLKTLEVGFLFFLGFAMSSLLLFPAYELLSNSQRAVEPLEFSWAFLPWQKIITIFAPDYFGNHSTINYWGPTDYTTTTGYIGSVALIFLMYAVQYIKKYKNILCASSLLIISLVMSFPTPVSIALWKSGAFGLQAASAHRALVIFIFSSSILCAYGLNLWQKNIQSFKTLLLSLIPIVLLVIIFGSYALVNSYFPIFTNKFPMFSIEKWKTDVALRNLVLPTLFMILTAGVMFVNRRKNSKKNIFAFTILILAVLELFRFGWKFTPFTRKDLVYPTTPVIDYLKNDEDIFRVVSTDVIPINMKMAYGIESLEGYDAIYPVNIAKFIAVGNSNNINADPQGRYASVTNYLSRFIDISNVKYLVQVKKDKYGKPDPSGSLNDAILTKYEVVFEDKSTSILKNNNYFPRVGFFSDFEVIVDDQLLLEKLIDVQFDYRKSLLINSDPQIQPNDKMVDFKYNFKLDAANRNQIELSTDTKGLLFVSDLYYPGWKAYVDGVETEILRANYTFRAVPVDRGNHTVEFVYRPQSFYLGVKISMVSFLILLIYTLISKKLYGNKNSTRIA